MQRPPRISRSSSAVAGLPAPVQGCGAAGTVGFHPAALRVCGAAALSPDHPPGERNERLDPFSGSTTASTRDRSVTAAISRRSGQTARSLIQAHRKLAEMVGPGGGTGGSGKRGPDRAERSRQAIARSAPRRRPIDWQPGRIHLAADPPVGDPYPGAFTFYKGQKIRIDAATPVENSRQYIGLTGADSGAYGARFIVLCGYGECIEAHAWEWTSEQAASVHGKLAGPDPLQASGKIIRTVENYNWANTGKLFTTLKTCFFITVFDICLGILRCG